MDFEKVCLGCMKEKNKVEGACPHCGFDKDKYHSEHHHLPLNSILNGKYMVGKVLGEGGFGITYIAIDLNLDMPVAIKEYYPNGFVSRNTVLNGDANVTKFQGEKLDFFEKGLERFLGEAKSIARFYQTGGIAKVIDFFKENDTAYIVMEFVDGITLKEYLKQNGGKMDVETVLGMMEPVIRSLEQVHEAGLIHRDISPDNIMINKNGDLKLLDFGAARKYEDSENKSLSIMLKPGYAPEEQYRTRGNQGPFTDVYALSATMYKMLTGKTPPESLERRAEDDIKWPNELGIQVPENVENAIKKGMEVLSKDRIQNMQEMASYLYGNQKVVFAEKKIPEKLPIQQEKEEISQEREIQEVEVASVASVSRESSTENKNSYFKEHALSLAIILILGVLSILITIYLKNKELEEIMYYGTEEKNIGVECCQRELKNTNLKGENSNENGTV